MHLQNHVKTISLGTTQETFPGLNGLMTSPSFIFHDFEQFERRSTFVIHLLVMMFTLKQEYISSHIPA